jgi:Na+-driven multidrug efflux pump
METDKTEEGFCVACLAVPAAFIGVGTSAYGSSSRGSYKKQKKTIFWIGIITTVISILIAVYYLWIKECSECLAE